MAFTPTTRFEEFIAGLEERGASFIDRRGRRTDAASLVRTVTYDAIVDSYNAAQLVRGQAVGAEKVLVADALFGDTDTPCEVADGQVWSLPFALANKKEHPNCTRAFTVLPATDERPVDRE